MFSQIVSMLTQISRHFSALRIKPVPSPLAPGPGIVLRQALPLQSLHALQ